MADIKISELTRVSALNNGDLVEVSQVNSLAPSGYTSLSASMTDIGSKVNSDIEYTTDLSDFTDKTITGAINEVQDNLESLTATTLPLTSNPSDGTTKEAIDELQTNKVDKSELTPKRVDTSSAISVNGNNIYTHTFTVNNATHHIVTGYAISNSINIIPMQVFFSDNTTITVRVRNMIASADTCNIAVFYI